MIAAVLLAAAPGFLAGPAALERYEFSGTHMGTTARIVVFARDRSSAEAAAQAALARIGALDALLSDYRDDSEIAELGRAAAGPPVAASPDLLAVLAQAQDLARRSGGAFDVTVGPLSRLWRRARRTGDLPDAGELAAARALVGMGLLDLDLRAGSARLKRAGMRLDLGGIAKGYAADQALDVLRAAGLPRALVTLGGEVVAGSPPPGLSGWTVAVRTPGSDVAPLLLAEAAASTSGDEQQWVEIAGVRYSHVLDPRTGQALTGRRSVTVVAPSGLEADGLATAVSVMGADDGIRLIEATRGASALVVEVGPEGARPRESLCWATLPRGARIIHEAARFSE
jgi:thiamine biosynthesis lipoprotein